MPCEVQRAPQFLLLLHECQNQVCFTAASFPNIQQDIEAESIQEQRLVVLDFWIFFFSTQGLTNRIFLAFHPMFCASWNVHAAILGVSLVFLPLFSPIFFIPKSSYLHWVIFNTETQDVAHHSHGTKYHLPLSSAGALCITHGWTHKSCRHVRCRLRAGKGRPAKRLMWFIALWLTSLLPGAVSDHCYCPLVTRALLLH